MITPQAALIELLARVGAEHGATALVSDHELNQWPGAAVATMKTQRLLAKARPASSVVCPGCEHECMMPVHTLSTKARKPSSFIVCDKRSDINRVPILAERLTQWQCTADAVCEFVATSIGLRRSEKRAANNELWNIGVATGNKRSQMLCLKSDGVLTLIAGSNTVPLVELIDYNDGGYALDGVMIRQLVDAATTADNRYTPTNTKREARKLDTQKQYQVWQKAYREWKRRHPGMTDVWYSQQIAKTGIAHGRDAETIRKHMQK